MTAERNLFQCGRLLEDVLQWGRGWLTAERTSVSSVDPHDPQASMGPRLVDRGEDGHSELLRQQSNASMGPRLVDRGERAGESQLEKRRCGFNGAAVG